MRHLWQPNLLKGLTKLAIILNYKHPWMLCLADWSKIGPDFTILSGLKIEVTKKIILTKNVRLTQKYSRLR